MLRLLAAADEPVVAVVVVVAEYKGLFVAGLVHIVSAVNRDASELLDEIDPVAYSLLKRKFVLKSGHETRLEIRNNFHLVILSKRWNTVCLSGIGNPKIFQVSGPVPKSPVGTEPAT